MPPTSRNVAEPPIKGWSKISFLQHISLPPTEGEAKQSRSRGAIFSARASFFPASCLTASPFAIPTKRRGSGTPRNALFLTASCGRALPPVRALDAGRAQSRSALASRRSTAALVGRLSPPNSAPGHASWDLADVRSCWPPTEAKIATLLRGRYPRPPVPVQGLNTRTGRSTGALMPKAARERVTSPRAGAALAPFQGVSSRRTSLSVRARRGSSNRCAALVNRCRAIGDLFLDFPALFASALSTGRKRAPRISRESTNLRGACGARCRYIWSLTSSCPNASPGAAGAVHHIRTDCFAPQQKVDLRRLLVAPDLTRVRFRLRGPLTAVLAVPHRRASGRSHFCKSAGALAWRWRYAPAGRSRGTRGSGRPMAGRNER